MNKEEFLRTLRMQLSGELSQEQILQQIQYYEQYIDGEVRKGQREAAVIEELGDPRLIAKTLIDTKETGQSYGQSQSTQSEPNRPLNRVLFGLDLSTWYGKALLILAAIAIIVLVVTVLSALLPFLLLIFLVSVAVRYFRKR